MKLKDVWVNVKPKIDVAKSAEAAKQFGDAIQGGLKGVKATAMKFKGGYDKMKGRADKGIAILNQITSIIDKMYDRVVDLTGTAGDIADLAYALGTTETRLLSVQRAFGDAGMGNVGGLNDMLVKYQEAVTAGKIELLDDQDILGGFLDMLQSLKKLNKEEQDAILAEIGFGRQNVMMKKLMGTDLEQVRANLLNEQQRDQNRAYAGVLGAYSDLGDTMEYLSREQELAMMLQLGAEATKDAIDALNLTHELELKRAELYDVGDLKEGARLTGAIETVQSTIPNLLRGIMQALTGEVEQEYAHLGFTVMGKDIGVDVPIPEAVTRLSNLGSTLYELILNIMDQFAIIFGDTPTIPNTTTTRNIENQTNTTNIRNVDNTTTTRNIENQTNTTTTTNIRNVDNTTTTRNIENQTNTTNIRNVDNTTNTRNIDPNYDKETFNANN